MKLLDLHISGFGKFHDRDLTFQDGLTVLYGKNEAGKSTPHTFIRSMLFGMERGRGRASKNDTYSKYEPWEAGSAYGGRLRFEQNGTVYRIERNFQKDKKVFTIVNETLGREEAPSKAFLDHLLCGLNETSYNNTVSIGQLKSTTDGGMVTELRNYIANMNTTGAMALNITKAAAYLKARRKEFERQLNQEAAGRYTALIGEIHTIEREISAPEYENQSPSSQHMKNQTLTLLAAKQKEQETLAQKIAKGRQILAGAELQNASSIAACRKETTNLYNEYQFVKEACEKKSKTVLASLFLILAVISAVWTAVLAFPKLPAFLSGSAFAAVVTTGGSAASLSAACGMLTPLFATAGIFLGASQKRQKQTLAHTEALLGETFSRHLGNASVSEEAMRAFHARMEEYLRFIQVLEQSEASTAKLAAEISALQERAASCDELLSRQRRVR